MFSLAYLYIITLFSVQLILANGPPHKRGGVTVDTNPSRSRNPNNKVFRHYTALGDKLAAGVGLYNPNIEDDTNQRCQRSVNSYPIQFVKEFGDSIGLTTFNFPACNTDSNSSAIGNQIESGVSLSPLPRIWYDFGQPDLVTISIGIEENNSLTQLRETCVYPLVELSPDDQRYTAGCYEARKDSLATIANIREQYENLFVQVQSYNLAPNQKREVYVIGLPHIYSLTEDSCPDDHRSPAHDIKKQINRIATMWNDKLREVANNVGVIFVDVDKKFDWHRICDKDPWFHTRLGQDFLYPTAEGYSAMKDAFAEVALEIEVQHNEENGLMVLPNR